MCPFILNNSNVQCFLCIAFKMLHSSNQNVKCHLFQLEAIQQTIETAFTRHLKEPFYFDILQRIHNNGNDEMTTNIKFKIFQWQWQLWWWKVILWLEKLFLESKLQKLRAMFLSCSYFSIINVMKQRYGKGHTVPFPNPNYAHDFLVFLTLMKLHWRFYIFLGQ